MYLIKKKKKRLTSKFSFVGIKYCNSTLPLKRGELLPSSDENVSVTKKKCRKMTLLPSLLVVLQSNEQDSVPFKSLVHKSSARH